MDARELLVMVDGIARKKGLNQSQWSRASGHAANGQTVSRIMHKGDCRVSTFLALLDAIGCEIEIKGSDL